MSDASKLYIAGTGMITPVGFDTVSTAAAVRAGVSGYAISNYYGSNDEPITMASVPNGIFSEIDANISGGNRYNERHDRVIKMAILAIREACAKQAKPQPLPLVLGMPVGQDDVEGLSPFIQNLEQNCTPWISVAQCRSIYSGRAAGMEAIEFAFRYLYELPNDFMLIGGSDSYRDYSRLSPLTKANRLLVNSNMDGFAPGEAAGFLLLTRHPEMAKVQNGHIIALRSPGIVDETGHMGSDLPYRGDGLDQAFKKAHINYEHSDLHSIYSSMNGENHWAKEYGVAYLRNKSMFLDPVNVEHPADIIGDVGAATAPVLIALAAENLFKNMKAKAHLVYSSSDTVKRGAIVVEKLSAMARNS